MLAPVALIALTSIAGAQLYTGSLTGRLQINTAVVPGAKITVTDVEKGFTYTATSNADGRYVVRQLAPGKYNISIEAASFQGQKKTESTSTSTKMSQSIFR